MKKIIIGIFIIGLSIFVTKEFLLKKEDTSPIFIDRNTPPSLVEVMAEPASFVYGSSIDVWFYKDSTNQIEEIAVTGHADSRTCGLMSSLFFNTYLQKHENPNDFFVAGAGRLVNRFDDSRIEELEKRENVKLYLDKHGEKKTNEFLLELFSGFPTYSETEQSPLEEYKSQLKEIERELEALENDPDVKGYKRILDTQESFSKFAEESNRHSENSGLVRIHQIPVEMIKEVEERIKSNVSSSEFGIIKFSDILEKYDIKEGMVWTETYRLDNGEPLVIELPIEELSAKSFEKAKEENKNEVEVAMVGDAKRRINFFNEQIIEINTQKVYYAQLPPERLKEKVYLNKCISSEGVVYDCEGEYVTREQYFQDRIPGLIKFLQGNVEDLELMMTEIEKDKNLEQDSKLESINHMTLIDAMLRDWNLPVGSSQKAFDKWREEQREYTWERIKKQLETAKIPVKALESENIVFAIQIYDDILEIKPMQILDLSNSLVVLRPDLNIAKVESSWSQREKVQIKEELVNTQDNSVSPTIMNRIAEISKENNAETSEEMLLDLLNTYPKQALLGLEEIFSKVSDSNEILKKELIEKVEPSILTREVLATMERFNSNPEYEDDLIAYVTDFRNVLLSYPDAPVDLHLSFATRLAQFLAEIRNMQSLYTLSATDISAWEVIEKCETSTTAFEDESKIIREKLEIPFSLADEIRRTVKLIKRRENKYYELAKSLQGFPKEESDEFKKLTEQTEEITLFEREAQNYLSTIHKLKNYSFGENAATELAVNENPKLKSVISELTHATSGNQTSKNLFFINAIQRLNHHIENNIRMDNIARIQLYHTIQTGCETTLTELKYINHQNKNISGYDQLYSRFLYESGEYGLAISSLFDSLTSVIAYHPELTWKVLEDDWIGYPYPKRVKASIEKNTITVKAYQGNKEKLILEITNLPVADANSLSDKINEIPLETWQDNGKLSSKILMAEILVREDVQNLFEVISTPKVNLAMLKAMVYASIPPATELVEPGGEDKLNDAAKKRNDKLLLGKIKDIKVPTLDEFENIIGTNLEAKIQ